MDDQARAFVSTHAGAFARTAGTELAAVCDLDETRAAGGAERFGVVAYTDHAEMFRVERPDIVSVCTPADSHLEVVRDAIAAGVKAVFCEKPITGTLAEADEMIRVCAENGVVLVVDHQRRFNSLHQEVRKLIADGDLGRIQQVACYYTAGILNTGTHLIDLLRLLLGDVDWVTGRYSRPDDDGRDDPNVDGWVAFKNGTVACLQACDAAAYNIFEVAVLGERGRITLIDGGLDARFEEAVESARFGGYRELRAASWPWYAEGSIEFMLDAVGHLVDCVENGAKPLCSGKDGRAALEGVLALKASARLEGQTVSLPL